MDATHARAKTRTGAPARNPGPRHEALPGSDTGTGPEDVSASDRRGQYNATGALAAPLIAHLEGVIPSGPGRWHARCPAHDDRSPSLSIRDDGDKVLLHCFAGCDPSEVLTAVGLAWTDIYPDRDECAYRRPNESARKYARRTLAAADPLEIEREILRIAAADRRAGRPESVEDRARVQVAVLRIREAAEVENIVERLTAGARA